MSNYIDIVFDGPPAHESGRFVEVEDPKGAGVGDVGEWVHRDDGYWVLRIPDPRTNRELRAELEDLRKDQVKQDLTERELREAVRGLRGNVGFLLSAIRSGEPVHAGHCQGCDALLEHHASTAALVEGEG